MSSWLPSAGRLLLVAAGALATGALWAELSRPFFSIFLCWAVVCLVLMLSARGARRVILFNAGFALLALSVAEFTLGPDPRRAEGDGCGRDDRRRPHAELGYAFVPDKANTCRRYYEDTLLYEVTSTIGADGLRISPPADAALPQRCVLFFGGSFTFGSGVADDRTFPFLVGAGSAGRTRVYNFGVGGYGPHQMLAGLEGGFVAERVACDPSDVIYLAIFDHARRVAGLGHWGVTGPRYVLEEGVLRRAGMFEDLRGPLARLLFDASRRSFLYRRVRFRSVEVDEDAERLFAAVTVRAAERVRELFPGARFHVIYWDQWDGGRTSFQEQIVDAGIPLHRVSTMLPGLGEAPGYRVHRHDGHPSQRAHELIAEYVSREIVGRGGDAAGAGQAADPG